MYKYSSGSWVSCKVCISIVGSNRLDFQINFNFPHCSVLWRLYQICLLKNSTSVKWMILYFLMISIGVCVIALLLCCFADFYGGSLSSEGIDPVANCIVSFQAPSSHLSFHTNRLTTGWLMRSDQPSFHSPMSKQSPYSLPAWCEALSVALQWWRWRQRSRFEKSFEHGSKMFWGRQWTLTSSWYAGLHLVWVCVE